MKTTWLGKRRTAALKRQIERPRPSPWAGHDSEVVTPRLLPLRFGDGAQLVGLSFYAAPELVIMVPFDSRMPLDLDFKDRCAESPAVRCFRDALETIYDALEDYFDEPPLEEGRTKQLREEEEDDEVELFSVLLNHGTCWCHAEAFPEPAPDQHELLG